MKYIAHRGNDGNKAENRMNEVLKTLQKENVDGVEIDIHITKDAKFILSHNLLLKEDLIDFKNVTKYTVKELKKYHFVVEGKPFPIHTLDEFLKKVQTNKIIIIECKLERGDYKKYAKAFLKAIHPYKNLNLSICSFNYKLIYLLKQKIKKHPVGLLVGYTINNEKEYSLFDYVSVHYNSIDEKVKKRPYYVWTVDEKDIYNKLDKKGTIIGIITDKSNIFGK